MNSLSADEILSQLDLTKVTANEVRKAVRQFFKCKAKLREKKMGHQKSWLLVSVERCTDGLFIPWLADQMRSMVEQLPNSAYKVIVAFLANEENVVHNFADECSIQSFSLEEGFAVVVLPASGMIGFLSPPGNLKRSLEYFGRPCEWNWPVQNEMLMDGEAIDVATNPQLDDRYLERLSNLHSKYGQGEGCTIALIDSGVCPNSKEFEGRNVTQILIDHSNCYSLQFAESDYKPVSDHGTLTATLAAGNNYGVAPKADLISFVVPSIGDGRFDHMALYIALDTLESDRGLALNGRMLKDKVDTVLLPLGIFLKNKISKEFREESVEKVIDGLNRDCQISIVAAIGNNHKKVAFPAEHTSVHAVGHLGHDGSRHPNCGFGSDQSGEPLPNSCVLGVGLLSVGRDNKIKEVSGSSFSASVVAGYFTLLSNKYDTSKARATRMHDAIEISNDERGDFKRLNPDRLL